MTYRNKLRIKRAFLVLGILILLILLVGTLALLQLGKYVVYTEDGAYFSFLQEDAPAPSDSPAPTAVVGDEYALVTGEPIAAGEVLGSDRLYIADTDIRGLYLDYDTLRDGSTLDAIDLSSGEINTLFLEMRRDSSPLLNTLQIQELLHRTETQKIRTIALITCLNDDIYAEAHPELGLQLYDNNGLWAGYNGGYFLDLRQTGVINYLAGMVHTLSEMGFHEVVLDEFFLPESGYVDYGDDKRSLEEATIEAYHQLEDQVKNECDLGLLITDPETGHQALDAAGRIYVHLHSGSKVKSYLEDHSEQYVVFITDSHDTRFNSHGKIYSEKELGLPEDEESENSGEDSEE